MLEEDRSRKGGKTACSKLCALLFPKQKSPRSYPTRGPQQPEGNLDTSGAGIMNCWEEKLTAGLQEGQKPQVGMWLAGLSTPPVPHLSYRVWTGFHSQLCLSFHAFPPTPVPSGAGRRAVSLLTPPFGGRVKSHLMLLSNMCLPSPCSAPAAAGVRTASRTLPSPNLSAGRSLLFSHHHAQQSRQLPSAIIRPHLTLPSTASCWYN